MPLIAPDHIEVGTGRLLAVRSAHEQGAISGKYIVDSGDVIYSKIRPYLMKAHRAQFLALCSADMYPLKPRDGIDGRYVVNVLLGRRFTNFAVGESMRSGIPKVNREALAGYELPVPPHPEQRAIGEVLGDADDLIKALERLIAKKRYVKQGMMQELLTGRTRLSGFTGDWQRTEWASITSRKPGNGQIKGRLSPVATGATPWPGFSASGQDVWLSTFDFMGDGIVVSAVGSRCGKAFYATGKWSAIANTHVVLANGRDLVPSYAFLHFNDEQFWVKGGSGQPFVQMTASLKQSVDLPPVAEQEAIASVLQDADAEIQALENRLESTRAMKVGMMQELLTGRTRLPVEEEA